MEKRIMYVYGNITIPTDYCYQCHARSFVFDDKIACCGSPCPPRPVQGFKIIADVVFKRHPISAKLARKILDSQDYCCIYCSARFGSMRNFKGKNEIVKLHFDHLIPFVYGGNHTRIVAACSRCNVHKSDKYFDNLADIQQYCQMLYVK